MKKAKETRLKKLKGQDQKAKGTSYLFGCQTPTDNIVACHHLYYIIL